VKNEKTINDSKNGSNSKNLLSQRILQLENELSVCKIYQQTVSEEFNAFQEELTSTNEELQSTNEELQSSNEELETAKEELQSSNEELVTVNDELQSRNSELIIISSDLNNLLNSVEIPILIVGNDHCIRKFTPKCEKAFNIISSDIGRPIGDIKSSIDLDLDTLISEVIQTLSPVENEIKDRQGRWMRLQIRPYRTIDNRIDGAVIALVDVDALKQQLNESIKARNYMNSISDAVNLPLVALNDQYCLEFGNQAFWEQYKLPQTLLGKNLLTILNLPDESKLQILSLLSDSFQAAKKINKIDVTCDFPQLGRLNLSLSTSLIHWEAVGVKSILLSIENITERKISEENLRLAANVFSSNLNGIIISDYKNNIIDVNPAFTKITGYEKQEVIGKNPNILSSKKQSKEFYDQMWNTLNQSGLWSGELINRKKDGTFFPESLTITVLKEKVTDNIKNYIGIFSDISIIKNYQNSLIESTQLAETANSAKSQFLATMSHEIRTPLNGILGMAQLLGSPDIKEDERKECAQIILKSGNILLTILNDILDLTKIESGKINFENIVFDPQQIISDTKSLFIEIANIKSLLIEEKWSGQTGQLYLGDPYRIRQMISNLLNNAIKFTQNGTIQIEAYEVERKDNIAVLEFSLLDTGVGISTESLTHIFEPFSQEDNSITRKFGGTGLGLSIVSNLAKSMGGGVGVKSIPNKGSRFWFRINVGLVSQNQVVFEKQKHFNSSSVFANHETPGMFKALVVDDDAINRLVIVKMLSRIGVQSTMAINGQIAFEQIKSGEKFDFILMDLQMPLMDGYTATKLIRSWEIETNQSKQLIIAFTADAYRETKQKCLESGMNDVLTKPVSFESIKAIIEKYTQEKKI